jgi:hypothetical protein
LSQSNLTTLIASSDFSFKVKWHRLYRGSENEYSATAFHRFCDNQGPTITLVKASNGRIAGGYSCVSWKSGGLSNPRGFLFSIDATVQSVNVFKGVEGLCKVQQGVWRGPWFLEGLGIGDKCDKNDVSYSIMGDGFEHSGDKHALFGFKKFTVAEYEVFGIELS